MKVLFVLALLSMGTFAQAADHSMHHHENLEAKKSTTDSLYQLGAKWTDQNGQGFGLKELEGAPVVIAMVYTSCQTACPLILEDMKKIQKALPDRLRESVRFVAVSFDPKRDTPAKLKEYGQAHGLAGRWTLLRGEAGAVRKLAAALGVQYQQDSRGDFQHSFQISVLNKNGEIAYQQNGIGHDPKAAVAAIEAGK